MWPLYLYAAGGVLTAAGELYCGHLNDDGIISIKNVLEVGLFWPAIVTWFGVNLTAEHFV
jgi:hypothetical protein